MKKHTDQFFYLDKSDLYRLALFSNIPALSDEKDLLLRVS